MFNLHQKVLPPSLRSLEALLFVGSQGGGKEKGEKPFETAKLALQLLEVLPGLASKGNANAVSDVGVAGLLASAACKGALFNVDINLDSLPEDMATNIRREAPGILEKSRNLSRQIMDAVRDRI